MKGLLLAALLMVPGAARAQSGTNYGYSKIDLSQTGTNTNPVKVTGSVNVTNQISTSNVSGSTVTVTGPNGALLATEATAASLFKAGQSIGNTQFGATQVGPWAVTVESTSVSGSTVVVQGLGDLFQQGQNIGNTTFGASQDGAWNVTADASGSTIAATAPGGAALALDATVGALLHPGESVVVSTGSVTAFQGGPWIATATVYGPDGNLATEATVDSLFKAGQSIGNTQFGSSQVGPWRVYVDTTNVSGSTVVVQGLGDLFRQGQSIGNTTFDATQSGAWHQTVDTGTITAYQGGAWSATVNTATSTIVSTGSITAFQGGGWTSTVIQGTDPWQVNSSTVNTLLTAISTKVAHLTFDADNLLRVVLPPPTAPAGTTAIEIPAYPNDLFTISANATVDVSTVIPNGQIWTIQRLKAGANDGGTGKNILVELYYDPIPPLGAGTERLDAIFLNASNSERVIDRTFTGNGTRRILLRTTQQGAASMNVYVKWTGFKL